MYILNATRIHPLSYFNLTTNQLSGQELRLCPFCYRFCRVLRSYHNDKVCDDCQAYTTRVGRVSARTRLDWTRYESICLRGPFGEGFELQFVCRGHWSNLDDPTCQTSHAIRQVWDLLPGSAIQALDNVRHAEPNASLPAETCKKSI